ncbi:Lipase 1 [Gryllus bimaculatus]|nr:Lipase 1 [Gryllus bimaculatus]
MRAFLLVALAGLSLVAALPTHSQPEELDEETLRQFRARIEEIRQKLRALEELAKQVQPDGRIEEDAILTTPELISKYGYPSETHEIITEDGYILTFHRIPYGRNSVAKTANPKPLYLQHGLMSSSDDWIITGPEKGFGYILADAGYDVWIGNSRGNKWSRRHLTLDPSKNKFWDFSWHEMGVYDLPAAIDYILEVSGQEQLHYVGHSMGTTMFTILGAERPEYNAKIRAAALLAPAVLFAHKSDPILAKLLGVHDVFKHHAIYTSIGDNFCKDGDPTQTLCLGAAELIGVNLEQFNESTLPVFLGHFPSGAAAKNYLHYGQSIHTGEFRQYDRGVVQNIIKYGRTKPPKYNLSKVTAPVAVHYSTNDGTVMPEDAVALAERLPNLIDLNLVPNERFNHLDFVIAIQAKELVYDLVISQLDQY